MPWVDSNPLEHSRPQNVPRNALHVDGAIGCWQMCTFDSKRVVDRCMTWNRGGLPLEDGQFVPYDGGPAATPAQLQINGLNSGPDRVELRNGRILIPKSREVQMRGLSIG
jgi:hypothetical protein